MAQLLLRRKTNDLNGIWGQHKMKSLKWTVELSHANSGGMCLDKLRKQGPWVVRPYLNLRSNKSYMNETMFHFQLSVESPEKLLLKCHLAILQIPQRKTENITFSKRTEVRGEEKHSKLFLFRAKFQPRIWRRLPLIIATCISKSISHLLICVSFIYPRVLIIQGLVHPCTQFRSGVPSHNSINWHGAITNLNIRRGRKKMKQERREPSSDLFLAQGRFWRN